MREENNELAKVELQAACEACNMLAICLVMLTKCPPGTPAFLHYSNQIAHYHNEISVHLNEMWLLTGDADPNDPTVQAMMQINREADKIHRRNP